MRETVTLVAVLLTILGCAVGVVGWMSGEINRLETQVARLEAVVYGSLERELEIAASVQILEARVDQIDGGKPKNPITINVTGPGGNPIVEVLDYLDDTPKRVGREIERTLKRLDPTSW